MDEQRRPRSREKKVVSEGKGVGKRGEGLGTGPVNNTGNYITSLLGRHYGYDCLNKQQSCERNEF